ncbi:CoA transferase [Salinigranum rubrum]|uniref:CoA transferase n=1 Tax=Salinigranum rubrum TaxID=755307 RepID=A0A2I8VNM5_9EURY|nr:CaiB/BaiF CoA-transferase family protein [Salinigranum rubrum]AUV82709.1 CoA transferase [Salinigranum rubrum]
MTDATRDTDASRDGRDPLGDDGSDRPLADTVVVELGHIVAGPFCSLLLADLGATVVKVEHPDGGDVTRDSSPLGNASFNYVNRDKVSVTLDLKAEGGREVFLDLVREADVLVENYGPGTTERLGVGYDDLREVNPRLVYCAVKGFNDGPYSDYPALDPVAEALSGLMSVTGYPDHPPARCGTSIADMAAALYGALSVVAALRQRERTGEGQKVSAPLFESTVALMGYWLAYVQAYDADPEPLGAGHSNWAPYDVFRTARDENPTATESGKSRDERTSRDENWVFIGPSSQRQWEALCDALDLTLDDREEYATRERRLEHKHALNAELEEALRSFSRSEVLERLREAGVPVAPVNDVRAVAADPHLVATDALTKVESVEGARARVDVPRYPVRSTAFDRRESASPPELGGDTETVLRSLGYSDERIAELAADGVV